MFDFNSDGHTDLGEQFIGYQIYQDVTGSIYDEKLFAGRKRRISGLDILGIVLLVYSVLNAIVCLG